MARNINLGDNADVMPGSIAQNLSEIFTGVITAARGVCIGIPAAAVKRVKTVALGQRMPAPRSDLGQFFEPRNLQTPALVIGQVQMQDVHLIERQQIYQAENILLGSKVACHVKVQSAVLQIRIICNRSSRERHRQLLICQDGQQALHGIMHPMGTFSGQQDTLFRKFHSVRLFGAVDFRIEPQSDRSASGNRIAAAAFPQEFVQQGRFVGKSFVRCNRHGRTHGAVSLAECHGFQRGDDIIRVRAVRNRQSVHWLHKAARLSDKHRPQPAPGGRGRA